MRNLFASDLFYNVVKYGLFIVAMIAIFHLLIAAIRGEVYLAV